MHTAADTTTCSSRKHTFPRSRFSAAAVETAVVVLLFLAVNLYSAITQHPIRIHDGKGWDGVQYYALALEFYSELPLRAEAPFAYRLGTPWLAASCGEATGWDLITCFRVVNLAGNFLTTLLLLYWLRLHVGIRSIRTVLVVLFLLQWHGPVRFTYFYPVYVDPWSLAFLFTGLIQIHRSIERPSGWNLILLGLLTLVGSLCRENLIIIPLAFAGATVFTRIASISGILTIAWWRHNGRYFIPLFGGAAGLLIAHQSAIATGSYSALREAAYWAYHKPLITFVAAWFFAFGPMIILPAFDWRGSLKYLRQYPYLAVYLALSAALGWIGGTDTERILFSAIPVVCVLVGNACIHLEAALTPALRIVLTGAQAVSQKWLLAFTAGAQASSVDTAAPSLWSRAAEAMTSYLSSLSYFCSPRLLLAYLAFYLLLTAGIWHWLSRNVAHAGMIPQATSDG